MHVQSDGWHEPGGDNRISALGPVFVLKMSDLLIGSMAIRKIHPRSRRTCYDQGDEFLWCASIMGLLFAKAVRIES